MSKKYLDVIIGEFPYNYSMRPKHSATRYFLSSGLFDGLNDFSEIEARISSLTSSKEIGDAFEV